MRSDCASINVDNFMKSGLLYASSPLVCHIVVITWQLAHCVVSAVFQAFGPIMPIMKFSSDEEAIRLANDSRFGLGCAVFSRSQRRARRIASELHCGIAAINDFASNYMCQVPF